jgi:hypothetical protein
MAPSRRFPHSALQDHNARKPRDWAHPRDSMPHWPTSIGAHPPSESSRSSNSRLAPSHSPCCCLWVLSSRLRREVLTWSVSGCIFVPSHAPLCPLMHGVLFAHVLVYLLSTGSVASFTNRSSTNHFYNTTCPQALSPSRTM